MFQLAPANTKTEAMRDVLAKSLIDLAGENENIVVLDADLIAASGLKSFQKAFPERTFDCGIQEANMIGVAAGMSENGLIPFTHTFSCFAARKCIDQVFLSASYAGLNVKMIGSDGAVTATTNGGSHQGMEDMGIFRNLKDVTLIEPSDANMLRAVLPDVAASYGVAYLRVWRRCTDAVYTPDSRFTIGKGNVLREGTDATVIASGIEVAEALKAAQILEQEGISVRVADMFTWKPLDEALIAESAARTGAIVTAENHFLATGLGAAVASAIARTYPVPVEMVGIGEAYGEVGDLPYLMKRFHLTAADICEKVRRAVARKET